MSGGMVAPTTQTVLVGDVRARLRELPDASVHCVVTSPPYFGLRNYNTEPQVWGGDPECAHAWGSEIAGKKRTGGVGASTLGAASWGNAMTPAAAVRSQMRQQVADPPASAFCLHCGCWRGHLGLEPTLDLFIAHLVDVFRDVRRVLRDDGTLWLNMGDSYSGGGYGNHDLNGPEWKAEAGLDRRRDRQQALKKANAAAGIKPKDLMMVPARLALALQADGWYVRSQLPWVKRNTMPESATDRPTTAIEYVYILTKSPRYYWDHVAVQRAASSKTNPRGSKKSPPKSIQHADSTAKVRNNESFMRATWDVVATRYMRNSDLFFESLGMILSEEGEPIAFDVNPRAFKGAHFATFPPKLIEPMILGSTSERGCCAECGAPWRRLTEKRETGATQHKGASWDTGEGAHGSFHKGGRAPEVEYAPVKVTVTLGWEPTCACDAGVVPCTVLDPFSGAGTTGVVCVQTGRNYRGIELSPHYAEMSRERIRGISPLFAMVESGA